jgi:hypothetical protein
MTAMLIIAAYMKNPHLLLTAILSFGHSITNATIWTKMDFTPQPSIHILTMKSRLLCTTTTCEKFKLLIHDLDFMVKIWMLGCGVKSIFVQIVAFVIECPNDRIAVRSRWGFFIYAAIISIAVISQVWYNCMSINLADSVQIDRYMICWA